jgi:DNA-binding SARP family transcriptional activator
VEFRILGPLEVYEGDRPLPLTGAKQRALLALLLLNANQVVSSDRLIDELWGEDSREAGSVALRARVSQLRKTLRQDVLLTRSPGYLIQVEHDGLDLHRFERLVADGSRALEAGDAAGAATLLREAGGLWRGPALADVAYESFAQPAIMRLEELRLAATELRVEADVALGRHAELVGELEALVAEHPLRERLRGQLMLALYRSGRQAEALDVYRLGRQALVEELGIEPGPALQELERAILGHDPGLSLEHRPRSASAVPAQPERAVLAAALDAERVDGLVALAESLARKPPRELILARLVPEESELAEAAARLNELASALVARDLTARAAVFTSARVGEDLVRLASEQDVDLILVDAPAVLLETGRPGEELTAVLAGAPCDVAVLAGEANADGAVLVPFGGAEHDWAAVELGAWLARARGVPLQLLGASAIPEAGKRDASRLLSHASIAVQRGLGVVSEPILVPPGEQGILEASAAAGLLVVGLSSRWHREVLGAARLTLAREAKAPVLLVRHGLRPGGLAPRASLTRFTWSVRVDQPGVVHAGGLPTTHCGSAGPDGGESVAK